jgi:hypothetical protein
MISNRPDHRSGVATDLPEFFRGTRPTTWWTIVVLAILAGTYTNLALNVGTLLYGFIPLVGGAFLFVKHIRSNAPMVRLLGYLLALCIVIDLGSVSFPLDWVELVQSTVLLMASLVAGLGLFAELRTWSGRALESVLALTVLIVLTLACLEAFTPFSQVSNAAREILYAADGQFLYSSDERDMFLHGTVRPKVFTQEPSHPAKYLAVAIAAWFLVSKRRHRLLVSTALFALGAYVLRSPSLVAGPILVIYFTAFGADGESNHRRAASRLCAIALCAIAFFTLPTWVGLFPGERSMEIAQDLDASTIIRLLGPLEIASEIVKEQPLFGVGIGGKEYAWETMLSVYAMYPVMKLERFYLMADAGWGNAFFQFVAYCGIAGGAAFLWWIVAMSKRLVVKDWASILFIFFVVFNVDGAFNIVRPWAYFFVLASAYHVAVRDRTGALAQQREESSRHSTPSSMSSRHDERRLRLVGNRAEVA